MPAISSKAVLVVSIVVFGISLCVAVPTFLTGCDVDHPALCPIFKPYDSNVTAVSKSNRTCTQCINKYGQPAQANEPCYRTETYTCYTLRIRVKSEKSACTINVYTDSKVDSSSYSIGDRIVVYVSAVTGTCMVSNDRNNFKALTYTGLSFFAIAALSATVAGFCMLCRRERHVATPEECYA